MKKENSNKKIGLVVMGVLLLVGVFYGGVVYGKSHAPVSANTRGQGGQAFGGGRGGRGTGGLGGFTTGEIIGKDDKSITVKLMDGGPASPSQGGSKIIFFDTNTTISKFAAGSVADLATGTQVSVTGSPNTDGSMNAQSVQIRPARTTPPATTN